MRGAQTAALIIAASVSGLGPARAGDAAARNVIGFSSDGRYFAVEQYTTIYDEDAAFSEYIIVDTATGGDLPDTPIKVLIRGDEGLDETKARAAAAAKARPLIERLRIGMPGSRIAGRSSIDLDTIGIYQMKPKPLATRLDVPLPAGRRAVLAVSTKPIAAAMCDGYGGRATPATAMGYGLTLTIAIDRAAPITLHRDEALPPNRQCAAAYGIAEAYLHVAADGAMTLAVLVEFADNAGYHAGPNRRFMVVSRRLSL